MYALKQLEDDPASKGITGLITLATPFLTLRRRRLHPLVLMSVLTMAILGTLEAGFRHVSDSESVDISQSILFTTAALFGIWIIGSCASALWYRGWSFGLGSIIKLLFRAGNSEDIISRELNRMKLMPIGEVTDDDSIGEGVRNQMEKVLVVRPMGDEASMGLVVSQFLSWALNGILVALASFVSGFRKVGWFSWIWKLVAIVAMAIFLSDQMPSSYSQVGSIASGIAGGTASLAGAWVSPMVTELLTAIAFMLMWGILALYVFFGLFSLIGLLVLLFAAIPFGPDAMFWNHFASTTAEASPPGPAQVYLQSPPPQIPGEPRKLAHSSIYSDKKVIEEICRWITVRDKAL